MAQSSAYNADAVMNALVGKASDYGTLSSAPDTYIALCIVTVTPTMTGSTITECTYTEYARIQIATPAGWDYVSTGRMENIAATQFPKSLGVTTESVVSFAICDALTAGNLLSFGTVSLAISQGIQPEFSAGDLDWILS